MSLTNLLVPTYKQMLQALSGWLDKAQAHVPEDGQAALLDEGRNAGERPGSLADAQGRIAETIALLDGLAPGALDGDPERPIAHSLPMGMIFDLTAGQYARDWALPQFYFHLMTAYAILRAQGIALGKADFVTHMFAYVRPGTLPA